MGKLITPLSAVLAAAVWVLLFVILGMSLGTSFIAAGVVLAAGLLIAALTVGGFNVALSVASLLAGIAAFAVLEVVLSTQMWVAIVAGLGTMGLYAALDGTLAYPRRRTDEPLHPPAAWSAAGNGHDRTREPVGAR